MRNLIRRRELFGAGIGFCASLAARSALAQSSETATARGGDRRARPPRGD